MWHAGYAKTRYILNTLSLDIDLLFLDADVRKDAIMAQMLSVQQAQPHRGPLPLVHSGGSGQCA